jgi:drug/metabolite transporter (DMT)-like permease
MWIARLERLTLPILGLVLLAAVAHATWNLFAKGAQGGQGFVWLYTVAASVLYLPVLVVALIVAPGPLGVAAFVFMAGSGALHTVYASLLQRGYRTGDLSLVYPLARGTGPLISTFAAIAIFGERPGPVGLLGALLIVVAVLLLARPSPDAGGEHGRAMGIAVLTGVAIAGYTLWDKQAVDALALSPLVYYWGTNTANALLLSAIVLRRRRASIALAWRTSKAHAVGVALLSPLAYVLILFALARAPVSAVAPARELSILVGTMLGTTVLSEADGGRRFVASLAILLGVGALTVG